MGGLEEGESVSVWMVTRGLSFWMEWAAASALCWCGLVEGNFSGGNGKVEPYVHANVLLLDEEL